MMSPCATCLINFYVYNSYVIFTGCEDGNENNIFGDLRSGPGPIFSRHFSTQQDNTEGKLIKIIYFLDH
jgi:hypothetical protein